MAGVIERRMSLVLEVLGEGNLVTADALAKRAGLTERSIYRYIRRLRELGHKIQSEAGLGYLTPKAKPDCRLADIESAIDRYHAALTAREHGGIAGSRLVQDVQDIMGKHWNG